MTINKEREQTKSFTQTEEPKDRNISNSTHEVNLEVEIKKKVEDVGFYIQTEDAELLYFEPKKQMKQE